MKPIIKLAIYVFLSAFYIKAVQMFTTLKLTNAVCESKNKSWVTFERCRLKAVNRYLTTLTIEATVLYSVNDADLHLQLMKKANGYKPFLINYIVDACLFMRKPNHPFVKIILNLIKNVSTLNHTCPYVGKQMLKDFSVTSNRFPLPLPNGEYAFLLTWIFDKKTQATTNVYFTFDDTFN